MHRRLAKILLIALSLIVAICSGCTRMDKKEHLITVTFWGEPARIEFLKMVKAEFEKINPDLRVKLMHIPISGYATKIKTMVGGGTPPDLMQVIGGEFAYMVNKKQLCNLADLGKIDKEDFVPQLIHALSKNNDIYGLTYFFNYLVLYYNKDIFDLNRIPYPDESWTWEHTFEVAKKLTVHNQNGIVQQMGLIRGDIYTLIAAWGGEIYNNHHTECLLTSREVIEAYTFWKKFIDSGATYPPTHDKILNWNNEFEMGRAAMMVSGTFNIAEFTRTMTGEQWDIAIIPKGKKRVSKLWINTFTIPSVSRNKQEAFKFLRFLTSPEIQRKMIKYGIGVPSRLSVWEDYLADPTPPENKEVLRQSLPYLKPQYTFPKVSETDSYISEEMDNYFLGRKTLEEAVETAKKRVDRILTESEENY